MLTRKEETRNVNECIKHRFVEFLSGSYEANTRLPAENVFFPFKINVKTFYRVLTST